MVEKFTSVTAPLSMDEQKVKNIAVKCNRRKSHCHGVVS